MYKLVAVFAALAMLVVAGMAQSSISAAASGGEDRLFGGGGFVFDFDPGSNELVLPRGFSVYATGLDGRRVSGTRFYGSPDLPQPAQPNVISCFNTDGGHAVIGGIDPGGIPYVQYFDDRTTAGKAPHDGITPVLTMSADEVAQLMPRNFPRTCPSTTPPVEWPNYWTTLDSGDIAVVDGQPG